MSYKYIINQNYKKLKDQLINVKDTFNNSTESIHKARNELKIIKYGDIDSVVKSFKIPNLVNQFAYSFIRDSKAKRSYLYSLKIKDFVPAPIAYIEFYSFGLLKESYFISENFDFDFTIKEPLNDENFSDRENIFKAFARFTLELHNNAIYHNDYSPGNILIKKSEEAYIFKIVDINRMSFFELSQEDRAKNFSKLWAKDDVLTIIADEYKKYYECEEQFSAKILEFSNKDKKMKQLKQKIKGR